MAAVLFAAFVRGLAESIGAAPFIVIVVGIVTLMLTDFARSAKQGMKKFNADQGQ